MRLASLHLFAVWIVSLMYGGFCQEAQAEERQWIELRVYHLRSEAKAELFDRTMRDALLPALKRQGIGPVGVFQASDPGEEGAAEIQRYVVIPYPSSEALANLSDKLASDTTLRSAAADYLAAQKSDPVYTRIESSLLKAFAGMPQLEVKGKPGEAPRLFELRIYESHSELKGALKVDMFNQGEIDIFREVGLNAVFFGEAVVGKNLPNLTYMLVHQDEESMRQAWQGFLRHPDWERMKAMPRYKDTVSKIIKRMLVPLEYSQIR